MNITKLYQLIVENTGEINRLTAKFGPESAELNKFYFKTLRGKYSGGTFIKDTNVILQRFNNLQEWEAFLRPWLEREDYYNAKNKATDFTSLYNALSDKDIYSYDFVINKDRQPENVKNILNTQLSYDIIYNDDTWLVVTAFQANLDVRDPRAINASKFFCKMKGVDNSKGSNWCVGWNSGSNYFGHYTVNGGPHYIIIKKGQTKYNIQLGGGESDNNKQDSGNRNLPDGGYNIFPPVIFNKIFEYAKSKGFNKVKGKDLIQNFLRVLRVRNYIHLSEVVDPGDNTQEFITSIVDNNIEKFKTLIKTNDVNKIVVNERIQSDFQLNVSTFTPLMLAYIYHSTDILQYLLTLPGININNEEISTTTPLGFIINNYIEGKFHNKYPEAKAHTNLMLILNSDQANLNNKIYSGHNILTSVISKWTFYDNSESTKTRKLNIINILIERVSLNNTRINNMTLLMYIFSMQLQELYPLFINHPALDINEKDPILRTIFSYLLDTVNPSGLKYLLENCNKKIDITGYKWILRLNGTVGTAAETYIDTYKNKA